MVILLHFDMGSSGCGVVGYGVLVMFQVVEHILMMVQMVNIVDMMDKDTLLKVVAVTVEVHILEDVCVGYQW